HQQRRGGGARHPISSGHLITPASCKRAVVIEQTTNASGTSILPAVAMFVFRATCAATIFASG
ncbi:MAG: hypothetical protein ABW213_01925, partial [Tardiphaga sp.]